MSERARPQLGVGEDGGGGAAEQDELKRVLEVKCGRPDREKQRKQRRKNRIYS